MLKIEFKDDGQDILWWIVDMNGIVLATNAQSFVWVGTKITGVKPIDQDMNRSFLDIKPGDTLTIKSPTVEAVGLFIHPVEKVSEETIYQGKRISVNNEITVLKNGLVFNPKPSQKYWNHSPDGFNWGYGGSGPAQLALALLLDVTGDPALALKYHQHFKRRVVANLGDEWLLTKSDIDFLARDIRRENENANTKN
jgi:hypothetical protein